MDELNMTIARNLQVLRKNRNLSLGQLAELSGISKVLLSNIEKGNNNPTINTIWKIANGLKVPYTALIDAHQNTIETVSYKEALSNIQYTDDKKCSIYCYYPTDATHNFEFFGMNLENGAEYTAPGHPDKAQEYIFVKSGKLTFFIENKTYILEEGDSMHFDSSQPHIYKNNSDTMTSILIMNYYVF